MSMGRVLQFPKVQTAPKMSGGGVNLGILMALITRIVHKHKMPSRAFWREVEANLRDTVSDIDQIEITQINDGYVLTIEVSCLQGDFGYTLRIPKFYFKGDYW